MALSLVFLAAFAAPESRLARRGGAPLIASVVLRQGALAYGALRAGLTCAPTAVGFGVVGLTWRKGPAVLQRRLVPGGF
jgi:hypothetical protein